MTPSSQCGRILAHLQRGHSITPIEALNKYGALRLAARINNLREAGWRIGTTLVTSHGRRYARYWLRR